MSSHLLQRQLAELFGHVKTALVVRGPTDQLAVGYPGLTEEIAVEHTPRLQAARQQVFQWQRNEDGPTILLQIGNDLGAARLQYGIAGHVEKGALGVHADLAEGFAPLRGEKEFPIVPAPNAIVGL